LLVLVVADGAEGEFLKEEGLADDAIWRFAATEDDPEEEYLPFPFPVPLPLPPRTSRNAWAPKERRRANGEPWLLGGVFSLSSTASSKTAELDPTELDKLSWRTAKFPKGDV
jgi:hypothetical protein